jgi:hypothetical protein
MPKLEALLKFKLHYFPRRRSLWMVARQVVHAISTTTPQAFPLR